MSDEPGYITELKQQIQVMHKGVTETEKSLVRIDTTLAENLPEMKEQLQKLNGTVRQHDKDLALQQQAHDDCPARKAFSGSDPPGQSRSQWVIDLSRTKTKAVIGGGVIGIPATMAIVFEIVKLAAAHLWRG